jgi:NAD(P)H-dependent FMN reductase
VQVLGISGSAAFSHRTFALINEVMKSIEKQGNIQTDIVDLSSVQLEFCDGRPYEQYNDITKKVLNKVRDADAFAIGSPMYRGTMTGALKNLIDLIPHEFIQGKVAGLIGTGGSDHHYLGLELGLRSSLTFFPVHTIPGILYCSKLEVNNGEILDRNIKEKAFEFGKDIVEMTRLIRGKAIGPSLY